MNPLLKHFRRIRTSPSAVFPGRIALFIRYPFGFILAFCLFAFSAATAGPMHDFWKFDGQNWVKIVDNAPPVARYLHTAVVYNKKMYIFGGQVDVSTYLNDLWSYSYDTNSWVQEPQNGVVKPAARANHGAVVTEDGSMLIYGGKVAGGQADPYAWKFDFATETWTRKSANPYGSRDCQGATTVGNKMYVFGGNTGTAKTNDAFSYDAATDTWKKITTQGTPPDSRAFVTMTTEGSSFYVFGGENNNGVAFNDAWELNTTTNTWNRLGDMLLGLTRASGATLQSNSGFFKFSSTEAAGGWEELKPATRPSARAGHTMVTINGNVYLFGGYEGKPAPVKELEGAQAAADRTDAGPAASSSGKTYHIIFGGVDTKGKYSDKTYRYSGATYALNFAQIGNGLGVTSETVFANPSATSTASARLEFFDDVGLPAVFGITGTGSRSSIDFSVPPLGSVGISTDGGGPLKTGSAVVTADNVLGGVIRFGIPGIGIAGVGDSEPLNGFVIPVRRKAGGINTGVALRNVEAAAIGLSLTLRNKQGQVVAGGTREIVDLAAQGHLARFIDELFPSAVTDDFEGTLVVQAVRGKVAAVALELGPLPGQFTTLPVIALK